MEVFDPNMSYAEVNAALFSAISKARTEEERNKIKSDYRRVCRDIVKKDFRENEWKLTSYALTK